MACEILHGCLSARKRFYLKISPDYRYPFVRKWLLLNLPLMINWHKSRAGLMKMPSEQEVTMIFGEQDPSSAYSELIDLMQKENIKRVMVPAADHNFSNAMDAFIR